MESVSEKIYAISHLLLIDILFLIPLVGLLALVAKTKKPAYAVLKRNFLAYFMNPTGYVFLCLFVWLASIAAFWPEAFFASNLANLDQLNRALPLIMLVFIPAITMSIWAEERRQGTDELLLTIPATDIDIVLGKYLAAVSIFTVSLLFSQLTIFLVLINLGDPDVGLFAGNHFGYWMVGLSLLAVGMIASFLTSNLTVGFILGAAFCAILVFPAYANLMFGEDAARVIATFSIAQKFRDFEGGVVSFSGLAYFAMIVAVSLYLCMVLIGRRHWSGGTDGRAMGGHYLLRTVSLVVIAASVSITAAALPLFRWDFTETKLSSLSDNSVELIHDAIKKKVDDWNRSDLATTNLETAGGNRFVSFEPVDEKKSAYISQDINVIPSWKSVGLSARIRVPKSGGGDDNESASALAVGIRANFYDEDSKQLGNTVQIKSKANDDWVTISKKDIDVPDGASRLTLRVGRFNYTGLVEVDDVKASAISGKSDSTGGGGEESDGAESGSIVRNGDFEQDDEAYAIKIEAFISKDLPEEFVERRFNLLTALREIKAEGGDRITLKVYDGVDLVGTVATYAEDHYGIGREPFETRIRGARSNQEVIFGVAFTSAMRRSVVPFMAASLPIEYELVRSLAAVTEQERRKVGILTTDANLMSGSRGQMGGGGDYLVISELRKQYEVVEINPNEPISMDACDVLLAVQPSSLNGQQDPAGAPGPMEHFIQAVRDGMPTAIFEDPFPNFFPVVGTTQPKRPQNQMPFGQPPPPQPKGKIAPLWNLLGVNLVRQPGPVRSFHGGGAAQDEALVVWQEYNPHPEMEQLLFNQLVWITPNCGAEQAFGAGSSVTSGLQEMMFVFPGGLEPSGMGVNHEIIPLITTGKHNSGTISREEYLFFEMRMRSPDEMREHEEYRLYRHPARRDRSADNGWISKANSFENRSQSKIQANGRTRAEWVALSEDDAKIVKEDEDLVTRTNDGETQQLFIIGESKLDYILGAHIRKKTGESTGDVADSKNQGLNVVLVSDIDIFGDFFFQLRQQGELPGFPESANWKLDNVTLLLNILDLLSGDDRFIDIRKRRRKHRELTAIMRVADEARTERDKARKLAREKFKKTIDEFQQELDKALEDIKPLKKTNPAEYNDRQRVIVKDINDQVVAERNKLTEDQEKENRRIDDREENMIKDVQDSYKRRAVLFPPIPPLLIAICVFFVRRSRERETITKSRLVQ
ncbi:MAG: Gldg family protein [Pirellulales bacterium]